MKFLKFYENFSIIYIESERERKKGEASEMTECYPCFREDITADINALGLQDEVVYCENNDYERVV